MTALLLVHGRSQEMAAGADRSDAAVADPLASRFSDGGQRIRDERTFNPTYLSDPDVAGPIGDVLARG